MSARIIPPASPTIAELARAAGAFADYIDSHKPGSPAWIAAMWFEASCHDQISELANRVGRRSA